MYIDCDSHYFTVKFLQGVVKMVKELPGMSDADKEKILGANAMRLFGMR